MNVPTRSTAAVASHLSWRRSSPDDPRKRTTTATIESRSEPATGSASRSSSVRWPGVDGPKGSFRDWVHKARVPRVDSANEPPINQPAGRQRGEGR
jgi:hypothetical protein